MVEINKAVIEQFMGPIAEDQFKVKVSLFVVSKKNQNFKKIDLENLTPEQRAAKLHKWAQEHRFVAVIEMGDMIFAHAHGKHVERLEGIEQLSLNGKKVTVKALTDQDAERLSAVGEAFEEHVVQNLEEKSVEKKEKFDKEDVDDSSTGRHPIAREYLAKNRLVSDQLQMHFLLDQMVKNKLGKIITNCIQQYNEARRQEQKQQEAEYQHTEIIRSEVKKGVLRNELKNAEIGKKEIQEEIIIEDGKNLRHIRGGTDV